MQWAYFAIIAGFVPVVLSLSKLLHAACRKALRLVAQRLSSAPAQTCVPPQYGVLVTLVTGVTLTQAVAQLGRWFVWTDVPPSDLLGAPGAVAWFVVDYVLLAPVIESGILALVLEFMRGRLRTCVSIGVAALAFGILHGIDAPFWFFPAATLFAYCASVYLSEVHAGSRRRALWLISATHVLNNAVGLLLILAREIAMG